MKSTHYKSLVTEKLYSKLEYCNHGKGGLHKGFKDLPKDEYPYTLIYELPVYYPEKKGGEE